MNIVHLILSTHAGDNGSRDDKCIWHLTLNGQFSVNIAYNSFDMDEANASWKWDFIWKLRIPPKVKTFLWSYVTKSFLLILKGVGYLCLQIL